MRSQLPGLVNFTQSLNLFAGKRKISIQTGKYKILGLNRDFQTDIFTVSRPMHILSLFAVEGSLVPAFHVIFAEILCLSS